MLRRPAGSTGPLNPDDGLEIWKGRNAKLEFAKILQGDITRIAQLCPNYQPEGNQIAQQTSWAGTLMGFPGQLEYQGVRNYATTGP